MRRSIKNFYQKFQVAIRKRKDTKHLYKCHWKVRGSFTVEAAMIVPIVLICILLIMNKGIELYTQTLESAQNQEMWENFEPVKRFRNLELFNDLTG